MPLQAYPRRLHRDHLPRIIRNSRTTPRSPRSPRPLQLPGHFPASFLPSLGSFYGAWFVFGVFFIVVNVDGAIAVATPPWAGGGWVGEGEFLPCLRVGLGWVGFYWSWSWSWSRSFNAVASLCAVLLAWTDLDLRSQLPDRVGEDPGLENALTIGR